MSELLFKVTEGISPNALQDHALFLREVFENSIFTADYLNWEYNQSPYGKALNITAYDQGKIVAHMGALPRDYKHAEGAYTGYLAVNGGVSPPYGRRGIFSQLIAELKKTVKKNDKDFIFGVPNSDAINGWIKAGGAKHLGTLELYLSPSYAPQPSLPVLEFTKNHETAAWLSKDPAHRRVHQSSQLISIFGVLPRWFIAIISYLHPDIPIKNTYLSCIAGFIGKGPTRNFLSLKLPSKFKPAPLFVIVIADKPEVEAFFETHEIQAKDFDAL